MDIFKDLKERIYSIPEENIKIGIDTIQDQIENKEKILIKEFIIKDISKIKSILNFIKTKSFIAIINLSLLRKNKIESKIAIKKFKEFSNFTKGNIAFIDEDLLILTPEFVEIHKGDDINKKKKPEENKEEEG